MDPFTAPVALLPRTVTDETAVELAAERARLLDATAEHLTGDFLLAYELDCRAFDILHLLNRQGYDPHTGAPRA